MARHATLADLLLRASADDLARAASRDQPAAVDGALLRRAAEEPQPLDGAALARIRTESGEALYAGASPDRDFEAAEFGARSITGTAAVPAYAGPRYLAVAVPADAREIDTIQLGGGFPVNQFDAFSGPQPVEIAGKAFRYWRTKRPFSDRSSGIDVTVAPFGGGESLWDAAAVDALPGTLARIEAALEDADAEIDGRIGPRYPSAAPARTLTAKAVDVAVYAIVGGDGESEEHRRWIAALRWMDGVAAGRIDLEPPERAVDDAPTAAAPPAVFGDDALRDYVGWRH